MPTIFLALLALLILANGAFAERSLFSNPLIESRYSTLLQEKNARADSLLPALDGDRAMNELLRERPGLWSIERLDRKGQVLTLLHVDLVYLDGVREDPFCKLDKYAKNQAGEWNLSIGVDFVSAASNIVGIHVQQCLDMVRNEMGYTVQDTTGKVFTIPPKKVIDEIARNKIPDALDPDLQVRLLKAHQGVELSGKCPADIEAYAILLEVWKQVRTTPMDLLLLEEHLDRDRAGSGDIQSCAFSREWNKRYQESASLSCDFDASACEYRQSEDGLTRWRYNEDSNRLEYKGKRLLFIPWGAQSIHRGGTMLDLRIVPLSTRLFLEAYLGLDGEPVSLGLIIAPEDKPEE